MGKGSILKEVKVTSFQKEKTDQDATGSTGFPVRLYDFFIVKLKTSEWWQKVD